MGKKKQAKQLRAALEQADKQLHRLADEARSLTARTEANQARLRQISAYQAEIQANRRAAATKLVELEQAELYSIEPPIGSVLRWKHRFSISAQMYVYTAMRVRDGWLTSSKVPSNLPQFATWAQVRAFLIKGGQVTECSLQYGTFYPIADAVAAWRDRWEDASPFDPATSAAQLGAYARRPWYNPDSVGAGWVADAYDAVAAEGKQEPKRSQLYADTINGILTDPVAKRRIRDELLGIQQWQSRGCSEPSKHEPLRPENAYRDFCGNKVRVSSVLRTDGSRMIGVEVNYSLDDSQMDVDLGFDSSDIEQLQDLVTDLRGRLAWLEQEPPKPTGLGPVKDAFFGDKPGTNTDRDDHDEYGDRDYYSQASEWHPGWPPQDS
jgi:hypothetical protein